MARGQFPFKLFVFAFLGWTFDFYDLVLIGFIKDSVASELHMTHASEAIMLTIALSTSGIGGIVSGMLADRVGKRTLLSATVLTYSLGVADHRAGPFAHSISSGARHRGSGCRR